MRILIILTFLFSLKLHAQEPVTSASFEQYGDHILIQLSVDDSEPLDFIFDTGAGLTVIDMDVAKKLNLMFDHQELAAAAQGEIKSVAIKHSKIEFNNYVLESDIKLNAAYLKHLEISIGRDIDGIIGYDLAHHHIVRLDYEKMMLEIYEDEFPKRGKVIKFKSHLGIPTIDATLRLNNNESVKGTFFVNTGAGTTLDFNTPFANKNDIIHKTGEHYSYLVKDISNNETLHFEGIVKMLEIDDFKFAELPIGISQVEVGIQANSHVSGIIGNKFLRKFNILFDYPHHKIYLEKSNQFDADVSVNCSGMDVQMNEEMNEVLIHQVITGGPAEQAGLQVNDQIKRINGKNASELSLVDIENMLKKDGENAELVVERGDKELKVSFILSSLL